jgi:hypothetical protein
VVAEQGAAFVFLLYVLQSSVMVVFGIVPLYSLQLRFRDLFNVTQGPPLEPEAPDAVREPQRPTR